MIGIGMPSIHRMIDRSIVLSLLNMEANAGGSVCVPACFRRDNAEARQKAPASAFLWKRSRSGVLRVGTVGRLNLCSPPD